MSAKEDTEVGVKSDLELVVVSKLQVGYNYITRACLFNEKVGLRCADVPV